MAIKTTVLFGKPQHEIASLVGSCISRCVTVSIVVGFATLEGIRAISPALVSSSLKLRLFVLGASTFRGFEALDRLLLQGVAPQKLMVHLGHSRPQGRGFQKYHPMLHSKIYLCEMPGGQSIAIIGSHNLTGFALLGLNGEASVMLEGDANDPEFDKIRQHIDEARIQSIQYHPSMKEALTWWASEFVNGLWRKLNDQPDDTEHRKTIVILAAASAGRLPKKNEIIYFELPLGLGEIGSLRAEIHIHIFAKLPPSPQDALDSLKSARASLWCQTIGLEKEKGGVELNADWEITDRQSPMLQSVVKPFRPRPGANIQQVRVKVWNQVYKKFEYLFGPDAPNWEPEFDYNAIVRADEEWDRRLAELELKPEEHGQWYLVRGLKGAESNRSTKYLAARNETSPESGNYVLMSPHRRNLSEEKSDDNPEK